MKLVTSIQKGEFRAGGVRFDNWEGIGSVPAVANVAYQGVVALMTPAVFLSLAPELPTDRVRQTSKYLQSLDDPCLGSPFLDVEIPEPGETGAIRIAGHEGRHRMQWIADNFGPDVEIPVAIFFRTENYSLRSRHLSVEIFKEVNEGVFREKSSEFVPGPLFSRISWSKQEEDIDFSASSDSHLKSTSALSP